MKHISVILHYTLRFTGAAGRIKYIGNGIRRNLNLWIRDGKAVINTIHVDCFKIILSEGSGLIRVSIVCNDNTCLRIPEYILQHVMRERRIQWNIYLPCLENTKECHNRG
ncbi:hypothetical protein BMS3Abin08_00705 [bacterium BMS3Abin08]|nr:hypothetical protein BMS3Abin08_00705 [bacterium BMS3Abin08]